MIQYVFRPCSKILGDLSVFEQRPALTADREGELPGHIAVPKSLQGRGHLVPRQLTGELRIDLVRGHQPDEICEVAAERIATKEQNAD